MNNTTLKLNATKVNNTTTSDLWSDILFKASLIRVFSIGGMFIFSVFLNSLCIYIIVKLRKHIKQNIVFMVSLSIFNLLKLNSEFMYPLIENYSWKMLNEPFCNLRYWSKFTFGETCSWILVFMSFDRILLLNNKQVTQSENKAFSIKSFMIVVVLFLFFSLLNSIMFIFSINSVIFNKDLQINKCAFKLKGFQTYVFKNNSFNYTFLIVLYTFFYSFLPFILLLSTNIIIFRKINAFKFIKSKMNAKKLRDATENARVLLILSFFFFISSLPAQFCNVMYITLEVKLYVNIFQFCYYILLIFESLNNAMSILIFILTNQNLKKNFVDFIFSCFNYRKYLKK